MKRFLNDMNIISFEILLTECCSFASINDELSYQYILLHYVEEDFRGKLKLNDEVKVVTHTCSFVKLAFLV